MARYSLSNDGVWVIPEDVVALAERSNVPQRFLRATLHARLESSLTAESCRNYVTSFPVNTGTGLVLVGPTGTGKTHYACAILLETLRTWHDTMDVSVFFLNVQSDLAELLDSRHFRHYDQYTARLKRITEAGLVVIDDLLHVPQHEFSKDILYRIYEARYAAELPTITTLNAIVTTGADGSPDWSPVSDIFNEPFTRRLVQTAGNNVVLT